MRIGFTSILVALLLLTLAPLGDAAPFPERAVHLIVAYPPGGPADTLLRSLADIAARELGQPVIVENRPGANGTLGVATMVRARPDGYTISQIPITVFTAAHAGGLPFDARQDITYIVHLTAYTFGLVVRADAPWKSVADLIAHARAHPGEVMYGTTGPLSPGHLTMEHLGALTGTRFTNVPFKGIPEAVTALMAGDVHAVVTSSGWAGSVESGALRLLATISPERSHRWRTVPTLRELGYDIVVNSPFGLGGPKGMDAAVVGRLHDAFRKALDDPSIAQVLARLDQVKDYRGSADYSRYARKLYDEQGVLLQSLGMRRK